MKIVIKIEESPYQAVFSAIDTETYDAEVVDGYWCSSSPTGWGRSPWSAARDLIDQMEEEDETTKAKEQAT